MKKSVIYILFTFITVAGLLGGCSKTDNADGQVTRGEWIAMLSEAFAFDTYSSDSPYYSDIGSDNDLFSPVQASAECGVLSIFSDDKLNADLSVTRDEAASTAAIAAGFGPDKSGEFDTAASITYAIENGIIEKAGKGHLTTEECETILDAAQTLYLTNPGEEKIEVEYADDLIDLREMSNQLVFINESEVSFPAALTTPDSATISTNGQAIQIAVGNTFLVPATEQHPVAAAYKVVSICEENGQVVFSVTAPDFGDIYDCADIHTTVSLSDKSIIWADGVKASPVSTNGTSGETYHIQLLSSRDSGGHQMQPDSNTFSLKHQLKFNTGVRQIYQDVVPAFLGSSPEVQALESSNFIYNMTPSLADFNGSLQMWTKELEKAQKYEEGYDITIDLDVQLAAIVDVFYDKSYSVGNESDLYPESASMILHSKVIVDFSMEGGIGEEKKIELGRVIIPVGQTGLTVEGYLFLYLEATGEVEIKLEMENTQRTGWDVREGRQGYQSPVRQRPGQWGNNSSAEVTGSVDLSTGAGLEVNLCSFSTVKLIGVDWKTGGDLEAKGTLTGECTEQTSDGITTRHYTETLALGSTFYLPVSTITVSGPDKLSDILGLEKSWDIHGKEEAIQIPFLEAEWIIWEATTTIGADGVETVDFMTPTDPPKTYTTRFGEVNAITCPTFIFDYPSNWTITKEDVTPMSEWVTLSNDRGATVDFINIHHDVSGGSSILYHEVEASKVADSKFVPGYVQATNYSNLGKFMVAELKIVGTMDAAIDSDFVPVEDGTISYAVLPESYAGLHTVNSPYFMDLAFQYSGNTLFVASPPGGQFTPQEEKEVIEILSSFREQ